MKKRVLAYIMTMIMCMGLLVGCGGNTDSTISDTTNDIINDDAGDTTYSIVCTIFPEYDWVCEILGEKAADYELTLLLDSGVDLHNYQPTVEDISTIATCDVFIYVGGESDAWAEDILTKATNDEMQVIKLMDVLGDAVKEEEVVEGMEHEHEEESGENDTEAHDETEEAHDEAHDESDEEHEHELDEHVWLSLKNAQVLVEGISSAIQTLDETNKDIYQGNTSDYLNELAALDAEFEKMVAESSKKTMIFGDRFPFRYLADDYGLDYYAAFSGCSAESEASFETIAFLAEKVDENGIGTIFTIDNSDQKIAETIIENTTDKNQKIATMDSMQSVTMKDVEDGANYLDIMKENLESLKAALQ